MPESRSDPNSRPRAALNPLMERPLPRGAFGRFREGLWLFAIGIGFLRRTPRLWPLAMVPVAFAALCVVAVVMLFANSIDAVHALWSGFLPALEASAWWSWLWVGPGKALIWLLGWLAVVISFAVALIAGLLLANLLSAPFLDQLSQRVELLALGSGEPGPTSDGSLLGDTLRSFLAELQRLGFLASLWAGLSLAGFVLPGAHLITGPLLVATTILFLPLDYAGFALDRRQYSFRSRRRWLWQNLSTMSGFGGMAFVASLVPGLNLLISPALVTAGTLLVLRRMPEPEAASGSAGIV